MIEYNKAELGKTAQQGMLISAVYEYDEHEGLNLLMLDDAIPAGAKLY